MAVAPVTKQTNKITSVSYTNYYNENIQLFIEYTTNFKLYLNTSKENLAYLYL